MDQSVKHAPYSGVGHASVNWGFASPDHYIFHGDGGEHALHLMVDGLKCAGCVRNVEKTLAEFSGFDEARANLSTHRLALRWHDPSLNIEDALNAVIAKGFKLAPYDPASLGEETKREDKRLLIAMGVAGFAAANVMMLSFAVWAGADSMSAGTRGLFHWLSALVAMPALAFSGRVFFASAMGALRGGRLNMDVPISLALILATGMSLYETITLGEHAYFDAAVSLMFFLLVGRYLDHRARTKARSAGEQLLGLQASDATIEDADGKTRVLPLHLVETGMTVLVAAGERIPVDGSIVTGTSHLDTSLVTGEALPQNVSKGDKVFAGTTNMSQPLRIMVLAVGEGTLLGEIARMMEAAEQGRGAYVRLADRVASFYAPVVHLLGLLTFLGWWLGLGVPWQEALLYAIAVLIITCPCALALAVPAVQVVASGRLMRQGILLKSGEALERMVGIDLVVFDKTGTLTTGKFRATGTDDLPDRALEIASGMAANSKHPLARAVRAMKPDAPAIDGVSETPGMGLSVLIDAQNVRLGNAEWCGVANDIGHSGPGLWLSLGGENYRFSFADDVRSDAAETVAWIAAQGCQTVLLSGDHQENVAAVAKACGIETYHATFGPADKARWIEQAREGGRHVLMVGDGLNDAPALAAAQASISPSTAADVSQVAADVVFQGDKLESVAECLRVSWRAHKLVRMNFALAFTYNLIAIPLAVVGWATPLVAAVAMSSSSVVVILNALRLRRG